MNLSSKVMGAALIVFSFVGPTRAQGTDSTPRHISIQEAVQLALKHNHIARIAQLKVEESQHAKEVAKSAYYPTIQNESKVFHITDTQLIQLPAGSLGTVAGTPIPAAPATINQGGRTLILSGTQLTQPITQLLTRVKPQNEIASAELSASRANAQEAENEIALNVHKIYYRLLITQLHRSAAEARIKATQELQSERVQQVKYGATLDEEQIESTAQSLQAKQELLTTDLQISDLTIQFDDAIGLPLTTKLELEPNVPGVQGTCEREECKKIAHESHPEILAGRSEVRKASAAVGLSKADYYPDFSAFARYSYQDQVPFLARNFGTFGAVLTYDLFDGGRRGAALHESEARLAQARENLARVTDEVELRLEVAYNKLERTRELVKVSESLLALRTESSRVFEQEVDQGAALRSQAENAVAQELDAKTLLLQSQLDYIQAHDEVIQAIGRTPE
jgi:outer membrane protein TolC